MHTTCKFIFLSVCRDFPPASNAPLLPAEWRYGDLLVLIRVVDSCTAPLQLLLIDFWSLVASIRSANGAVGYGEFDVGMDAGIGPQFTFLSMSMHWFLNLDFHVSRRPLALDRNYFLVDEWRQRKTNCSSKFLLFFMFFLYIFPFLHIRWVNCFDFTVAGRTAVTAAVAATMCVP